MKLKSFFSFVRSFDKFGEPVKMLYKGEDTYKTKLGAVFSILLNTVVLAYLVKKALDLVGKNNSDIYVLEKYTTRLADDAVYNLRDCNLKMYLATGLANEDYSGVVRDVPEKYGSAYF